MIAGLHLPEWTLCVVGNKQMLTVRNPFEQRGFETVGYTIVCNAVDKCQFFQCYIAILATIGCL